MPAWSQLICVFVRSLRNCISSVMSVYHCARRPKPLPHPNGTLARLFLHFKGSHCRALHHACGSPSNPLTGSATTKWHTFVLVLTFFEGPLFCHRIRGAKLFGYFFMKDLVFSSYIFLGPLCKQVLEGHPMCVTMW